MVSSAVKLINMWCKAKCWHCLRRWFRLCWLDVADAVVHAKQIVGIPSAFDRQQLGVLTAPLRLGRITLEIVGLR